MPTTVGGLPVGNVSVTGPDITVSNLLKNPRIIDQRLREATDLMYWANLILPNLGGDAGNGAIVFEEWAPNMERMDRKAEPLAPDAEVPLASTAEGDVKMIRVEVDGLGFVVTDEQRDRNAAYVVTRKERALANEIADKFNTRAIATVDAAITANSRTFAATDWSAIVPDGSTPTARVQWPHSTIALLKARQSRDRHPFGYDSMIAHPLDVWRLGVLYGVGGPVANGGPQMSDQAIARAVGLSRIIEDNTGVISRGSPLLFSSGNVGGTVWERPVRTEIVPERRRRRTVVQTTGSCAHFVDNPYGLLRLTGVAAADIAGGVNI